MRRVTMMGVAFAALMSAETAAADTVSDWWEVAGRYYIAGQMSPAPRNGDTERALSRTALAMFEAVNAIDRRYESYLGLPAGDPTASQDAAAATAAYQVLLRHHPSQKGTLEESYAMAMAAIPDGAAKEAGTKIGELAAEATAAARGIDPAVPLQPYRPLTTPGQWIGANPPSLEAYWGALTPWVLSSPRDLLSPPPPGLTSERYSRDYEEVRRLGGKDSNERTLEQTLIARYRQGYDLSPMVRYVLDRPGRRQVDNARLLALYQMAMDDAVQAMIVAKQHYNYWRPITAIRNGDRDNNPATRHDAGWTPLLGTPNFQEYPCGHCTAVSVQVEVLKIASGLPANTPVRIGANANPNLVLQTLSSWDEAVRQVSDSRMYGGVHYRFSNEAGEEIGRRAARLAVDKILRPLPSTKKRRR